jgi:hypothetical protein
MRIAGKRVGISRIQERRRGDLFIVDHRLHHERVHRRLAGVMVVGHDEGVLDALQDPDAPGFDGKVAALEGAIEHHVEEEEEELFSSVRKLMTENALEALGQMLEAEALRMMQLGAPRSTIRPKPEEPVVQP